MLLLSIANQQQIDVLRLQFGRDVKRVSKTRNLVLELIHSRVLPTVNADANIVLPLKLANVLFGALHRHFNASHVQLVLVFIVMRNTLCILSVTKDRRNDAPDETLVILEWNN